MVLSPGNDREALQAIANILKEHNESRTVLSSAVDECISRIPVASAKNGTSKTVWRHGGSSVYMKQKEVVKERSSNAEKN